MANSSMAGRFSRYNKDEGEQKLSTSQKNLLAAGLSYSKDEPGTARSDDGSEVLGFSTLPEQVHRKAVKRGFQLTLMVVGESGLGKSTLINTLFLKDIYGDRPPASAVENITKTTKIEKKLIDVEERGVKLRLSVIDTPGFSDSPNAAACWQPIEDYVDGAFEQYFKDECGLNRKNIVDNRVHCCLYFLASYARGLRQIDVEFMRRLQSKVNIVPIISKADSLTPSELRALKERIREDITKHRLQTYQFPDYDSDEDEDFKRFDADLKSSVPFAVIGSNSVIELDGGARKARGRQYAWGSVEVENPRHSDFLKLRTFLISSHMQDLKDITKEVHYENFRARYITERMNRRTAERSSTRVPGATNTLPGGATGSGSNMTLVGKQPGDSSPDLNAILDSDALLKLKEDELPPGLCAAEKIARMQMMIQKYQEQLSATKPAPNAGAASNVAPNAGAERKD